MAVYTSWAGNWRGDLEASLTSPNGGQTAITLLARIDRKGSGTINTYTFHCMLGSSRGRDQYGNVSGELTKTGWTSANQVREFGRKMVELVSRTHYPQTRYYYGSFEAINVSDFYYTEALEVTIPAKDSYVVSYNANGGTGAPISQTKWYNESLTLQYGIPTRSGYVFMGWNTQPDGTGTAYQPSDTYVGNAAITLYAMWKNVVSVKADGSWKTGEPKVKVDGSWKTTDGVWVKADGSWKTS